MSEEEEETIGSEMVNIDIDNELDFLDEGDLDIDLSEDGGGAEIDFKEGFEE